MTRRHLLLTIATITALLLLLSPVALAASDLYSNIGPGGSVSGLADRYPIGNYALDQHFDAVKASITGGVDASGIPSMIAFFLANLIWQLTAFIANAVIVIFGYAFSLDLLGGSGTNGETGALAPVGDAIAGLSAHTFGEPWAILAITLTGCWAMWRALIQRRYTETAAALGKSLVFCLIALAIVTRPDATIGEASRWTNQISSAFLSVTATGDISTGPGARRSASDQLFGTLILRPWVALNFGGTEHCTKTGTGSNDHDPTSVPVRPLPASAARRLTTSQSVTAAGKQCVNNTARYADHFLPYPPGSDDRNAQYTAINDADPDKLPDSDPTKKAGTYQPAIFDKPATDSMEKGGQYQRLLLALVILIGELGAFLLLGSLALSVVLSQIVVLLLACFAPVALVAGIIPGRGHELFHSWATLLITYLIRRAAYSLVLAIVLAVLAALQDATSNLGWLMSFGLQAALLWTVFLQRHALVGKLTSAVSGHAPERDAQLRRLLGVGYIARTVLPARRRTTTASRQPQPGEQASAPSSARAPEPPAEPPISPPVTVRTDAHGRRPARAAGTRARVPNADQAASTLPDGTASDRLHRHARTERATTGQRTTSGERELTDPGGVPATRARRRLHAQPARRPDRTESASTNPPAVAGPLRPPHDTDRSTGPSRETPLPPPSRPAAAEAQPPPPSPSPGKAAGEPSLAEQLRGDQQRLRPAPPDAPAPAVRRPADNVPRRPDTGSGERP